MVVGAAHRPHTHARGRPRQPGRNSNDHAIEETLVLVKPDGVARNLTGEILRRIEAKGYSLVDIRLLQADRELLAQHYAEHEGKPFYEPLVEFMQSGPIGRDPASRATASSRASACSPAPPTRRRRRPAPSAATSAATGASRCSRTSCTARTRAESAERELALWFA